MVFHIIEKKQEKLPWGPSSLLVNDRELLQNLAAKPIKIDDKYI